MSKFEVAIVYRGQTNYIVDAPDQETAERMAEQRYQEYEAPDLLGNEWEEVEKIVVRPMDTESTCQTLL
jgi:hypothetical protein